MIYTYKTGGGVCSQSITVDLEDGIVRSVDFEGGCDGNTQGIARLVRGRKVEEVISLLKGIRCGYKDSSCPDQLALALEKYMKADAGKKD